MQENQTNRLRRTVTGMLLAATLVFAAAVYGGIWLSRKLPDWRIGRVEAAIAAGDTALARRRIEQLSDEAQRSIYLPQCDYLDGQALLRAGDTAGARAAFAAAGDYLDAVEMVRLCDYQAAEALYSRGDWEGALEAFRALGAYADAADRCAACHYAWALELENAGDLDAAAVQLTLAGEYADAPEHLRNIARAVTGLSDAEEALNAYRGMSSETVELNLQLNARRAQLSQESIAVGFYHTVGLAADGSALACGDNSWGQCDVAGERDLVAVAAGAYHTLLLRADGTVRAVGRNTEGQCETAAWSNVVSVAASNYASYGLTGDGCVLCAGYGDFSEIESWNGIVQIAGGSYNLAVLRADGTVWTWPALSGCDELNGAASIAINSGYAAAVMPDGSLRGSVPGLPEKEGLVSVSASGTCVLALDTDGRIVPYFFRAGDAYDLSGVTDAVAVAAGGTHSAVVLADGSVTVFGRTDEGQGDTAAWRLKVSQN